MKPILRIEYLKHHKGLAPPEYKTAGSSGMDLRAAISTNIILQPGERYLVPVGFKLQLPEGYEMQIRPRSGIAWKNGITVINAPGTIDNDYRGEIMVALVNHGPEPFTIARGDRIAQMVIAPYSQCYFMPIDSVDETERGDGGFGSTGSR